MKLLTYNLHLGGRRGGGVHWDRMREEFAPDIIFAQEATRPIGLANHGLQGVWRRVEGREWGSAVVVRGQIIEELTIRSHAGWIIGAVVEVASGGTCAAICLHAPTIKGRSYTALLEDMIVEIAAMKLQHPLIIGGDMNLVSVGERQLGELVETTPAERNVVQHMRTELGLVSCWEAAHQGEILPQTLRWSRSPEIPYHCDVLFVPETWTVLDCAVPDGKPWTELSDHSPVVASVDPSGAAKPVAKPIIEEPRPVEAATPDDENEAPAPADVAVTAMTEKTPASETSPPAKASKQAPGKAKEPAAPKADKRTPVKAEKQAPAKVQKQAPAKVQKQAPAKVQKQAPAKAAKPARAKAAPAKAAKAVKAAPAKAAPAKAAPAKAAKKTDVKPVDKKASTKTPVKKAAPAKKPAPAKKGKR